MSATALAANPTSAQTEIQFDSGGSIQYFLTVPSSLAPGASGTVVLEGTWPSNKVVTVGADDTVTLTNDISGADEKELAITFEGIELQGDNTQALSTSKTISVANIEKALFGTWSGTFNYQAAIDDAEADDTITDLTGYTWIGNSEIDLPILEQAFDLNFAIGVSIKDFAEEMFGVSGIETFSDVKGVLSNFVELAGIEDFEDNSEILDDGTYGTYYCDGFNTWICEHEEENTPVLAYSNNSMYYLPHDLQLVSTGTVSFCIDSNEYTMTLDNFLNEYIFILNTSEVYRTDLGSSDFWNGEYLRTICIQGGTDATNTELIAWLQANGTLITTEDYLS